MTKGMNTPRGCLFRYGVLGVIAATLLCGCGREHEQPSTKQETLMLYCGAGFADVAKLLIAKWESEGGARLQVNYAEGGRLVAQILTVRRGDLFLAGNEKLVDTVIEKGAAIGETKKTISWFVPVIMVGKGNPKGIHEMRGLLRPGIRLGLGDERACPVTRNTLRMLSANGLSVEAFNSNVVYRSATDEMLPLAVHQGTIDAAIVWDTQGLGEAIAIPPEQNIPSPIVIVILKSSQNVELARKFVEFVTSGRGKAILASQHYAIENPGSIPKTIGEQP